MNLEKRTKKELIAELRELNQQMAQLTEKNAALSRKEREHAKYEARLLTIIENLPFDFFGIDAHGRYFIQNAACKAHWGDIIGKRPEDVPANKETLAIWLENNRRAFCGEIVRGEVHFTHNGETRHFFNIVAPIYDRGMIDGILGFNVDITEQKRAEEEKERILNVSNDLICIMGTDGLFKYVNPAWERTLGYTRQELLEKSVFELVHVDDRRRNYEDFFALLSSGSQNVGYENRLYHRNSSVRHFSWTGIPLPEKGLIYCIGHDITERKKTEEALKERERELEMKTHSLEEINTALKVLLQKRDDDRRELEEKVLLNIKEIVIPYLKKLHASALDGKQRAYVGILESNLNDIVSSFSLRLSSAYLNLTPAEIKIANLVKQGKTNKEIAELLNCSPRTAAFHRERIREKLGIKNKKTNLRSYLSSIN